MRYGQQHFDFDEGIMTFYAPNQVIITEIRDDWELEGYWLTIHPDFLQGFSLSREIQEYGFFSYNLNEALHLSIEEENTINQLNCNQFKAVKGSKKYCNVTSETHHSYLRTELVKQNINKF